jgi:hypothetical protein
VELLVRGKSVRDFARGCQRHTHASDRDGLWVVEDELALELGVAGLGRLAVEDDKGRIWLDFEDGRMVPAKDAEAGVRHGGWTGGG